MDGYPSPGEVVAGRYRMEGMLGEGGMGTVFRAIEVSSQRRVALKFVAPEIRNRPGIGSRFANEAIAASKIASEHAVKIFGVEATPDGTPFIVMELLEGTDLENIIEVDAPLPPERAVHFALQILRGLQVMHAAGVVHRDLKPSNCFVVQMAGEPDFVKLIDFGITKILGDESQGLTKTSTTLGTPTYMSPEQAKSAKAADVRSDLYSVGVILYELLTKKRPFDGGSHNELIVKICTEPPIPLKSVRSDLPSRLVAAVERALVKIPSGRYPDAESFAQALKPFSDPRSAAVLVRIAASAPGPKAESATRQEAAAASPSMEAKRPATAVNIAPASPSPIAKKNMGSTAPMESPDAMPAQPGIPVPSQVFVPAGAVGTPARAEEKTMIGEIGPMSFGAGAQPAEAAAGKTSPLLGVSPAVAAASPAPYVPAYGGGEEYDDDRRSGGASGVLWVLGFLALGLIGTGVYFAFFNGSASPAPTSTVSSGDDNSGDDTSDNTVKTHKKPHEAATSGDDDTPMPTATPNTAQPTTASKPHPHPSTTTTSTSTASAPTSTTSGHGSPSSTTTNTAPTIFIPWPFPTSSGTTTAAPPATTTNAPPTATTAPPLPPATTTSPTTIGTPPPPPPTSTVPPPPPPMPTDDGPKKPKIGGSP